MITCSRDLARCDTAIVENDTAIFTLFQIWTTFNDIVSNIVASNMYYTSTLHKMLSIEHLYNF